VYVGAPVGGRADVHERMDGPLGLSCWDDGQGVCDGHDVSAVQFSGDHFGRACVCSAGGTACSGVTIAERGSFYSYSGRYLQ
jgi:hypothetical protein